MKGYSPSKLDPGFPSANIENNIPLLPNVGATVFAGGCRLYIFFCPQHARRGMGEIQVLGFVLDLKNRPTFHLERRPREIIAIQP
jgi:hypothetical protein